MVDGAKKNICIALTTSSSLPSGRRACPPVGGRPLGLFQRHCNCLNYDEND